MNTKIVRFNHPDPDSNKCHPPNNDLLVNNYHHANTIHQLSKYNHHKIPRFKKSSKTFKFLPK